MKSLLILVILLASVFCHAQDWELVSEEFSASPRGLLEDTINNRLLLSGVFGFIGDEHYGGFASYNGETFQNYGCAFNCSSLQQDLISGGGKMTIFNDTVYLRSIYSNSDSTIDTLFNMIPNSKGVVRLIGNEFEAMEVSFTNNAVDQNIMSVFTTNDRLYVTANHMENVAGFTGYGGASYNGYSWEPFQLPGCDLNMGGVSGLVSFQNELYISGDFSSCGGQYLVNHIMRQTEDSWVFVGEPVSSLASAAIYKMLIYQNELYVCGAFHRYEGNNAGECIMKWNGEEWSDLGSGLEENGLNLIDEMVILNDELYICGRFTEVGGIPAHNLAKWDGNQWCAIENDFTSLYIRALGVYNNELYVYANTEDYFSRLWKWTGTATTCSEEFNSVSEQREPESLTLYPNPASDLLTITLPKQLHGSGTISITDGVGRTVEEFTQEIEAGSQMTIATLNLPVGLYTLKFRHEEDVYSARFVQE